MGVMIRDADRGDEFDVYPRYSSTFPMHFDLHVRDVRTKEVVGEFMRFDVVDDKLYVMCTLTRAYKSVFMCVSERDARGYETGKYHLDASVFEDRDSPLLYE